MNIPFSDADKSFHSSCANYTKLSKKHTFFYLLLMEMFSSFYQPILPFISLRLRIFSSYVSWSSSFYLSVIFPPSCIPALPPSLSLSVYLSFSLPPSLNIFSCYGKVSNVCDISSHIYSHFPVLYKIIAIFSQYFSCCLLVLLRFVLF